MAYHLKCQICGEKLYFNPYCPCSLGDHLIKKHPELDMTHFSFENNAVCNCDKKTDLQKPFQGARNSNLGTCPPKCMKNSSNKSGIFKTTVETWKPGPLNMTCPRCKKTDRPCIRKQRNKVAYTSFGAFCMLSCWPICFLPFLMPHASNMQLFCKNCGYFLGEYNRKTGNITTTSCSNPNRGMNVPSNLC